MPEGNRACAANFHPLAVDKQAGKRANGGGWANEQTPAMDEMLTRRETIDYSHQDRSRQVSHEMVFLYYSEPRCYAATILSNVICMRCPLDPKVTIAYGYLRSTFSSKKFDRRKLSIEKREKENFIDNQMYSDLQTSYDRHDYCANISK
uniref:Uncharacterized protein n=1 Tax=Vespula pensylvanica TaxID=30213 RepID=A0A834PCN4_VESPE|nr:hypothetical protein H0235_003689 [Vespula pensylvanica]